LKKHFSAAAAGRYNKDTNTERIGFFKAKMWDALRASTEMVGEFAESQILVALYNEARTYFQSRSD